MMMRIRTIVIMDMTLTMMMITMTSTIVPYLMMIIQMMNQFITWDIMSPLQGEKILSISQHQAGHHDQTQQT